jgi:hypothetical protein
MNFKQACTLQTVYGNWLNDAYRTLRTYSTKTTEKHMRSKVMDTGCDETIEKSIADNYDFSVNDVIHFAEYLLQEKEALTKAIFEAKKNSDFDIDGSLAMNKAKQNFANVLSSLKNNRTTTVKSKGSDFYFDAERKQQVYQYPLEIVTEADFNKNEAMAIYRRLMQENEAVSQYADEFKINVVVAYSTTYTIDMNFEEAIAEYLATNKSTNE